MELPPMSQLRRPTQPPARWAVLPSLAHVALCLLFSGRVFSDGWDISERCRSLDGNGLILDLAGGRLHRAVGRGREVERIAWL
jgi:hypothetical protein